MSAVQLDDLDRQLIEILGRDARVSNRKIAGDLGVTEGTVRGRIKRLQQERLIAFTAIYAALAFVEFRLIIRTAQKGPDDTEQVGVDDKPASVVY